MSIFKFSNAGGFGAFNRYNDFLAGNPTTPVITDFGSMFPIGGATLTSSQTGFTFSNIPQTYQHLQIRALMRCAAASGDTNIDAEFNGDTNGGNYWRHALTGSGSGTPAAGGANDRIAGNSISNNSLANTYSVLIMDIFDYANTSKRTTTRTIMGYDTNGGGRIDYWSRLWNNTAAVNSIRLVAWDGAWSANSSFALYGVKG